MCSQMGDMDSSIQVTESPSDLKQVNTLSLPLNGNWQRATGHQAQNERTQAGSVRSCSFLRKQRF